LAYVDSGRRGSSRAVVVQRVVSTIGCDDVTVVSVAVGGQGYSCLGPGETDPVPNQKKPTESSPGVPAERRGQARGDVGSTDWETIVLKRVERHVESLSASPDAQQEALHGSGWEETALLALRRRIRDLKT